MPLWKIDKIPVSYHDALAHMEHHSHLLRLNQAEEQVWLLEHPPLYTAGTSARHSDLIDPNRFPVFESGRGGQYTYHGPGQRIAYVMIDLSKREQDLRKYVYHLEQWIIDTLQEFGVQGERREGRIGIWVTIKTPQGLQEKKIAAIGVRVRKWITYHGIAINVNPDLDHFSSIVPCGLPQFGVTSLHDLGKTISLEELDTILMHTWNQNPFLRGLKGI